MTTKNSPLPYAERMERNAKVRQYLLDHIDDIHNQEDGFSIEEIATELGVDYDVITNMEKTLRTKGKLFKRDAYVKPYGEFEFKTPLRTSERVNWIKKHRTWPIERLAAKFGMTSYDQLRTLASRAGIKLHARSKKLLSKSAQTALRKAIEVRLSERITAGDLVSHEVGPDKLYELIRNEFDEKLKAVGLPFTKSDFPDIIERVYWTKGRLSILTEVMQSGLPNPIEEFCKSAHLTCTHEMAEKQAKYIKGITSRDTDPASFVPGLGRLDLNQIDPEEIKRFKFPEATSAHPYVVEVDDPIFTVHVINGPNIGLHFDFDIGHNVPRRALADSRVRGASAVVISGLFDLDLKKAAGPVKVLRALISGLKVKPETLEISYQEEAKRIIEDHKDISSKEVELLYLTTAERLELVIDAWHKIAHRPKNRKKPKLGNIPEYDGPILIVFGHKEEELISSAAYWEVRYLTIKKQGELSVLLKLKRHEIKEARKAFEINKIIETLEDEMEALERQYARTIITNVSEEDLTRQFRRILPLVIRKFEDAIPNSRVVGFGTTYIKFGDKVVEFNVPSHTKPTSMLLAKYTKAYGPKVLRGNMADVVVILHPHAVSHRSIDRSRDAKGRRRSVLVHVAPITVDAEFLRKKLQHTVRKVHPISGLIFNEEFHPGMLVLDFHNDTVDGHATSIPALALHEEEEKKSDGTWKRVRYPLMHDPRLRYIWLVAPTDPHYGSRNREYVWAPDLQQHIGVDEMIALLLKRAGMYNSDGFPFHMYCMNDDGVQANHLLLWQQQPSPNEMPQPMIEEMHRDLHRRAAKAKKKKDILAILAEATQLDLSQFNLRPPDWLQNQLRLLCDKLVDAQVDFFGSIVNKALKVGLKFCGPSDFEGTPYDSRNIGCINIGSGNHMLKGTNGEMTEGWIAADRIWLRLLAHPDTDRWRNIGEEKLKHLIRSPLYSNIFTAWGTAQAPGGYEWAFDLRSSPPKMKGWSDTLAGWVFVDPSRGNYARFYENPDGMFGEGRVVIKTCGDKHFHATASTPYAFYVMCAPGTHTDQFAEMAGGLPPNSTGITTIGMPYNGPGSGPIIVRFFPIERLKFYIEHPEIPIDWEAMYPNPL